MIECENKVMGGRRVDGATRWLVNEKDVNLELNLKRV